MTQFFFPQKYKVVTILQEIILIVQGKIISNSLVKMLVLKIFITGDICPFGRASLNDEP